jgi:hypothetical protein
MRRIVLPNRQRDRAPITPLTLLQRIAADTKTSFPQLRRAIKSIPDRELCAAWAKLSHRECDRIWSIFRSGGLH